MTPLPKSQPTPLIEVKDLKKYFKTPRGMLHAVDGVSFGICEGQTLGVVGESGCGKSTLGRTILRLLDPTGGDVFYNNENITAIKKREYKRIWKEMQMIFQDPFASLNPRMTVSEIIEEPLMVYGLCNSKEERRKKVRELMDTVGLAERFKNTYPHELDGGRRQRIGVARTFSVDPKFIVCDEPVSALDVSIQAQILNLMMDLQEERGITYMFITHDLSVVKHISDEICVMYLGHIVEKAGSAALFKKQYHPYTKALLSAIPTTNIDAKRERIILKGEISSPITPKPGCRFAPRCLHAVEKCMDTTPELTEVEKGHFAACHLAGKLTL